MNLIYLAPMPGFGVLEYGRGSVPKVGPGLKPQSQRDWMMHSGERAQGASHEF